MVLDGTGKVRTVLYQVLHQVPTKKLVPIQYSTYSTVCTGVKVRKLYLLLEYTIFHHESTARAQVIYYKFIKDGCVERIGD